MLSNGKLFGIGVIKFITNIIYLLVSLILLLGITGLFGYGLVNLTLGDTNLFYQYVAYGVIGLLALFLWIFGLEKIKFKSLERHVARKEGVLNKVIPEESSNSVLKAIATVLSVVIIIIILVVIWIYIIAVLINGGDLHGIVEELF